MNNRTLAAVTKALDTAIVSAADEHFNSLIAGLDDQEIVDNIHLALRSLERLQRGLMPDYDAWDALFYSLWYQPGHINLAYTLSQLIPHGNNPLRNGIGSLQVVDFGCGALAMQFGLALAAADALEEHQKLPQVAVVSEDDSEAMKEIGWSIWHNFVKEIAKYPELSSLREVCRTMNFDAQDDLEAMRWLTALHVAYEENAPDVKQKLDARVAEWNPDVVLVTTHEVSEDWAYCPVDHGYTDVSDVLAEAKFVLDGRFDSTTDFRSDLCDNYIDNVAGLLSTEDYRFAWNYLKIRPTAWLTTDGFQTRDFLYVRD